MGGDPAMLAAANGERHVGGELRDPHLDEPRRDDDGQREVDSGGGKREPEDERRKGGVDERQPELATGERDHDIGELHPDPGEEEAADDEPGGGDSHCDCDSSLGPGLERLEEPLGGEGRAPPDKADREGGGDGHHPRHLLGEALAEVPDERQDRQEEIAVPRKGAPRLGISSRGTLRRPRRLASKCTVMKTQ